MMHNVIKIFSRALLLGVLLLASCRSPREVSKVEGTLIAVDSLWDAHPDPNAVALLAPYKTKVDSMMLAVVGESEVTMTVGRPESLLSNLVADVLREAAKQTLGKPADMGLVNMGGLRNILSEGTITCGSIYEILPFENSLCVVSIKGTTLTDLFKAIAARKGEGVSGVKLDITSDGELLQAFIGGEEVDPDKTYTVATVDYLADGNDGMQPLVHALNRECPAEATLRNLFMAYVTQQYQVGKKLTSALDGRIVRINKE